MTEIEKERIYGIQNGGNRGNQYKMAEPKLSEVPTQGQLADMIPDFLYSEWQYK